MGLMMIQGGRWYNEMAQINCYSLHELTCKKNDILLQNTGFGSLSKPKNCQLRNLVIQILWPPNNTASPFNFFVKQSVLTAMESQ